MDRTLQDWLDRGSPVEDDPVPMGETPQLSRDTPSSSRPRRRGSSSRPQASSSSTPTVLVEESGNFAGRLLSGDHICESRLWSRRC